MKIFVLALCLLFFTACNKRPAPPPPVAAIPPLPEFVELDGLYRQFQGFRNDRLFLRFGFTANFPQSDWLQHVRQLEQNPELAERADLLANLAVASRIHGDGSTVTRKFEERFTASLHTPGPSLPPETPDQAETPAADAGPELNPPPGPVATAETAVAQPAEAAAEQAQAAATAREIPNAPPLSAPEIQAQAPGESNAVVAPTALAAAAEAVSQPQEQAEPPAATQEGTEPATDPAGQAAPSPTAQIVAAPQPQERAEPQTDTQTATATGEDSTDPAAQAALSPAVQFVTAPQPQEGAEPQIDTQTAKATGEDSTAQAVSSPTAQIVTTPQQQEGAEPQIDTQTAKATGEDSTDPAAQAALSPAVQFVTAPQPQEGAEPQIDTQTAKATGEDSTAPAAQAVSSPTAQIVTAPQQQEGAEVQADPQTATATGKDSAAADRYVTPAQASEIDHAQAMVAQLTQSPAPADVPSPGNPAAQSSASPPTAPDNAASTSGQTFIADPAQDMSSVATAEAVPVSPAPDAPQMPAPAEPSPSQNSVAHHPADDDAITILFTGDTQGVIYPQPGITGTVGGLARRPPIIESVRTESQAMVLLDAGDAFASGFPRAEHINKALVRAMNRMHYDAMGLGPHDFAVGEIALRELANAASFPMICSNLEFQKGAVPWIRPYALLDRGRHRIAVISLLFPDSAVKITRARVVAPQQALRKLIPQLAPQADVIVLMTQAPGEEIAAMLAPGADVDVTLGDARSMSLDSPRYIPSVAKGRGIGLVELRQTAGHYQTTRTIPLLASGTLDVNILKIIDTIPK